MEYQFTSIEQEAIRRAVEREARDQVGRRSVEAPPPWLRSLLEVVRTGGYLTFDQRSFIYQALRHELGRGRPRSDEPLFGSILFRLIP